MCNKRHMTKSFGKYVLTYIGAIQPDRGGMGQIRHFMPQSKYKKKHRLSLHKYGRGPFCRFRISSNLALEGVYVLLVNGSVTYVGECVDLSSRFNMGYGQISPRNCYEGGQLTNCKVNHLILETTKQGNQITLWFLKTKNRRKIEGELRNEFHPQWNG